MRTVTYVIGLIIGLAVVVAPVNAIDVIDPPVSTFYGPLFISGLQVTNKLDVIEIYNESSMPVDLSLWSIQYPSLTLGQVCTITLQDWIPPGGYIVASANGALPAVTENVLFYDSCLRSLASDFTLKLYDNDVLQETLSPTSGAFVRKGLTKTYRTNKFSTDFISMNRSLYAGEWYNPPQSLQLQISEVVANSRNCSPVEIALDCNDYVKLYNPTDQSVDLSEFRIRNGYLGQSSSSSNTTILDGLVEPGHFVIVPITVINSASWLWLEDMYGVRRYDNTVQDYPDATSDTKKGQAWAYDISDGAWKWTSQPTPSDLPSVFPLPPSEEVVAAEPLLAPCKDGQYRSEETNRCRSITVATSELTSCKEGQYRSDETNRCRSVVSAVASLIACKEGQERNLESNRCRSTSGSVSVLADCKEGQERNPETNRCRNVIGNVPTAAFAVEPIADTTGAFVGWWALGGIGIVALAYGGWEWRVEILQATKKLRSLVHFKK